MATAGLRQGFSFQLQSCMSDSLGDGSKGEGNILSPGALWDCQFFNPALVWCLVPGLMLPWVRWGENSEGSHARDTQGSIPCWEDSVSLPRGTSLLLVKADLAGKPGRSQRFGDGWGGGPATSPAPVQPHIPSFPAIPAKNKGGGGGSCAAQDVLGRAELSPGEGRVVPGALPRLRGRNAMPEPGAGGGAAWWALFPPSPG